MREFSSFGAFAEHLLAMEAVQTLALHKALDASAARIEKDAKDSIGTYQDATGAFPAWAELAPATVEDRVRQGYAPDEPLLREGDLRDSISRKTDMLESVIASDSDVMVYEDLGTEHIPPRPVLEPAAIRNEKHVVRSLAEAQALAWMSAVRLPIGLPKSEE